MYTDIPGIGTLSYSNRELSKKINMPETTIRRCNKDLEDHHFMKTLDNQDRDLETGCKNQTKVYNLKLLGQAIIWELKQHKQQLDEQDKRIINLENKMNKMENFIQKLMQTFPENETKEFVM